MAKTMADAGAELEAAWKALKAAIVDAAIRGLAHFINGVNWILKRALKALER